MDEVKNKEVFDFLGKSVIKVFNYKTGEYY